MGLVTKLQKNTIISKVVEELSKEKIVEATLRLKNLYKQRDKAKKVLRNIEREIEDYIEEIEQDDSDLNS